MTQAPENGVARSGADRAERTERLNLVVVAAIAAVLRLPAYFSVRHLTFDDGVFATSVLAMRDGGVPFKDVFSSQGPLFLSLAYLGDLIGLRTMDSPRIVAVLSGVAVTIFVFLALSRVTSQRGAIYGSLIVATSGSLMWVTAPLAADGPALAFAAAAFWIMLIHRERPRMVTGLLIGLLVGASFAVKAMNVAVLVPIALVLLAPLVNGIRNKRIAASQILVPVVAGLSSFVLYLAVSLPFGLSYVWDQNITYRTESLGHKEPIANLRKIFSTLWDRDLVLYFLAFTTIIWALWATTHRRGLESQDRPGEAASVAGRHRKPGQQARTGVDWQPSPMVLSSLWLIVALIWLVVGVSPMWRSHLSSLVIPAALVLALCAPPRNWLVVMAVLSLPLAFVQLDGLLFPGSYRGSESDVVRILRSLPDDAWVLSDEPGLVWRAGHRSNDDLVDPSMLRLQAGRYDENSLVEAAMDPRVCAVVVRSKQRFGHFPTLGTRLGAAGYLVAQASETRSGDNQRVYVRADCSPPS